MHDVILNSQSFSKEIFSGVPLTAEYASRNAASSLQVYENRVPSHHARQLTRGKFVVQFKDITLLECIGEGDMPTNNDNILVRIST